MEAVVMLASYDAAKTTVEELRRAFVRLHVMICEALQFKRNGFRHWLDPDSDLGQSFKDINVSNAKDAWNVLPPSQNI
uniref:Uncharacterized protein n=1 Tax=Oryza sativa subsp. japonica TaxID=39947 RepID=Q67TS7_ORYSJ|nr:hypothetical protein [Oryza sativa Japonica Group]